MTAWLLTWLWQGTALAAGMAMLLRCVPRLNATTKHVIWCAVLLALGWLGLATSPNPNWGLTPVPVRGSDPVGTAVAQPAFYVPSAPDFLVTIAIGIWAAIAFVNLVRLIPALHAMYALRDRCRAFPASLEARLPLWLETKDRGRRPQLMTCDAIAGATLLGLHNPCIAIPPSLINALSPDELDQVILHEYAHVQRRDDWVRLAQSLMLSALWIHPAAVLVSRAMSREREMACDEWVVARTGLPNAYARCLAHAAELRVNMRATCALLTAFVGHRYELDRRVDHLLTMRGRTQRRVSLAGAAAATVAITGIAVSMQGARFGEIGTIVVPHVASPSFARLATTPPKSDMTALSRQTPATRYVRLDAPAFAATAESAPVATPDAPLASAVLQARTFAPLEASARLAPTSAPDGATAGKPIAPIAPNAPSAPNAPNAPSNWRSMAAPGIEIASAAKKTSVGLAHVFSRAGVSLARSF